MLTEVFKKGDRVFHFAFGWGAVTGDSAKGVCDVVFENRESVTIPCKEMHLSFCKYDLINGGLSHERPLELEDPEFEPFQKVLVRNKDYTPWRINLFDSYEGGDFPYKCLTSLWSQCIPYEGNEHLLGTTKLPEK